MDKNELEAWAGIIAAALQLAISYHDYDGEHWPALPIPAEEALNAVLVKADEYERAVGVNIAHLPARLAKWREERDGLQPQ